MPISQYQHSPPRPNSDSPPHPVSNVIELSSNLVHPHALTDPFTVPLTEDIALIPSQATAKSATHRETRSLFTQLQPLHPDKSALSNPPIFPAVVSPVLSCAVRNPLVNTMHEGPSVKTNLSSDGVQVRVGDHIAKDDRLMSNSRQRPSFSQRPGLEKRSHAPVGPVSLHDSLPAHMCDRHHDSIPDNVKGGTSLKGISLAWGPALRKPVSAMPGNSPPPEQDRFHVLPHMLTSDCVAKTDKMQSLQVKACVAPVSKSNSTALVRIARQNSEAAMKRASPLSHRYDPPLKRRKLTSGASRLVCNARRTPRCWEQSVQRLRRAPSIRCELALDMPSTPRGLDCNEDDPMQVPLPVIASTAECVHCQDDRTAAHTAPASSCKMSNAASNANCERMHDDPAMSGDLAKAETPQTGTQTQPGLSQTQSDSLRKQPSSPKFLQTESGPSQTQAGLTRTQPSLTQGSEEKECSPKFIGEGGSLDRTVVPLTPVAGKHSNVAHNHRITNINANRGLTLAPIELSPCQVVTQAARTETQAMIPMASENLCPPTISRRAVVQGDYAFPAVRIDQLETTPPPLITPHAHAPNYLPTVTRLSLEEKTPMTPPVSRRKTAQADEVLPIESNSSPVSPPLAQSDPTQDDEISPSAWQRPSIPRPIRLVERQLGKCVQFSPWEDFNNFDDVVTDLKKLGDPCSGEIAPTCKWEHCQKIIEVTNDVFSSSGWTVPHSMSILTAIMPVLRLMYSNLKDDYPEKLPLANPRLKDDARNVTLEKIKMRQDISIFDASRPEKVPYAAVFVRNLHSEIYNLDDEYNVATWLIDMFSSINQAGSGRSHCTSMDIQCFKDMCACILGALHTRSGLGCILWRDYAIFLQVKKSINHVSVRVSRRFDKDSNPSALLAFLSFARSSFQRASDSRFEKLVTIVSSIIQSHRGNFKYPPTADCDAKILRYVGLIRRRRGKLDGQELDQKLGMSASDIQSLFGMRCNRVVTMSGSHVTEVGDIPNLGHVWLKRFTGRTRWAGAFRKEIRLWRRIVRCHGALGGAVVPWPLGYTESPPSALAIALELPRGALELQAHNENGCWEIPGRAESRWMLGKRELAPSCAREIVRSARKSLKALHDIGICFLNEKSGRVYVIKERDANWNTTWKCMWLDLGDARYIASPKKRVMGTFLANDPFHD